ncbi:CHAT domain-containing protein [Micromonospora sp. MH99]|uniref:CHAT domain-containing protein n=1 Tax=Micromonospora sp. MH99 TaxID=1945510 RepID=UPI001F1DAFCF|nr:CHAT domain-containing protein [Micromonospora sp. MH99]MCF0091272.1 hypothetical protein [Micromonospora sp. MH99]
MSPVIAIVSLRALHTGSVEVVFDFPVTGENVRFPLPDRRPLDAVRRKAGVYLDRLVAQNGRLRLDTSEARDAFAILAQAGWQLTYVLAQGDMSRIEELSSAFRKARVLWERTSWPDPDDLIPVVEMHCRDDAFPLELLPVFEYGPLPAINTYYDLVSAASRFLGFSTMVKRVIPARMPADGVLRNDPALPVQFIRHARLASTRDEVRELATMPGVEVEGPWPIDEDAAAVLTTLTRSLFDGSRLDGATAQQPAQIQHFACHCDTTTELDDDYTLTVSTRKGRNRELSLAQMQEAHWKLRTEYPGQSQERSVIILNACGSSRTNPLTANSFPRWFLSSGHRAFIGTEATVPDGVASAFATAFYGRLLERRRPLGEAVVWARRDLLCDFRNPLGLLYVLYGDADLTVEAARPDVYRRLA